MPAVDQGIISAWNEVEQSTYNSYPFWLAKYTVQRRKTYATHSRLFGKQKWTSNMGPIMRGVRKEPSPHLRQEFAPAEMSAVPRKDIVDVQEMTVEATLKRHRFESRVFPFYPFFNDFMRDHLVATTTDLSDKIMRAEDIFCRTGHFHMSPHVFVANRAGGEVLTNVPFWDGKDMSGVYAGTVGKTLGWRQSVIPQVGNPGNLSIVNVFQADSYLREDVRAVCWTDGSQGGAPKDDSPMSGKNVLVCSNEAYNQFRFDPFLLDNRRIDLDIVQHGFKGSIGDNVVCKIEDLPLRMAADGTFPAPETRVVAGAGVYNLNESVLNPAYRDAPYEWAWLYAADAYKSLEVGPPPGEFTGDTEPKGFANMFWNGEVKVTKLFNIPYMDPETANQTYYEFNTYGEHLKAISQSYFGMLGTQRRNAIPILFKRLRGVAGY